MVAKILDKKVLKDEYGSLYKPGGAIKVALVFPNSYYLGMSSLGYQVICKELNRHPDISCERVFLNENGLPISLETQRKLSDFDIIGFSLSFELDYINVIKIIHRSGIPLKSNERGLKDPIIISGGICSSYNPEPLWEFIDIFIIGDGEEVIHELISEYQGRKFTNRQDLLLSLSYIKGVYIPSLYDVVYKEDGKILSLFQKTNKKIERRNIDNLDKYDTVSSIITPNTEFANTFLIEVERGCANRCRFCIASYSQKCRFRSSDVILKLAESDLAEKAERIGLLGASVTDHPEIDFIAESLVEKGKMISVASMRADSVSNKLLSALAVSRKETITLAPEAGSERLRKVIGKDIPIEVVYQVIISAMKKGITNIKLYFMIGLPTETQEDIYDIIKIIEKIKKLMWDNYRPNKSAYPRLTISISPFVPKPHTPFQWYPMEEEKILAKKLAFIRQKIGSIGGIRFTFSSVKWSAVQGVIARGDRRLSKVLLDMQVKNVTWNKALKLNGLNQQFYLQRERDPNEIFPWEHINLGITRERLREQFYKSIEQ